MRNASYQPGEQPLTIVIGESNRKLSSIPIVECRQEERLTNRVRSECLDRSAPTNQWGQAQEIAPLQTVATHFGRFEWKRIRMIEPGLFVQTLHPFQHHRNPVTETDPADQRPSWYSSKDYPGRLFQEKSRQCLHS